MTWPSTAGQSPASSRLPPLPPCPSNTVTSSSIRSGGSPGTSTTGTPTDTSRPVALTGPFLAEWTSRYRSISRQETADLLHHVLVSHDVEAAPGVGALGAARVTSVLLGHLPGFLIGGTANNGDEDG